MNRKVIAITLGLAFSVFLVPVKSDARNMDGSAHSFDSGSIENRSEFDMVSYNRAFDHVLNNFSSTNFVNHDFTVNGKRQFGDNHDDSFETHEAFHVDNVEFDRSPVGHLGSFVNKRTEFRAENTPFRGGGELFEHTDVFAFEKDFNFNAGFAVKAKFEPRDLTFAGRAVKENGLHVFDFNDSFEAKSGLHGSFKEFVHFGHEVDLESSKVFSNRESDKFVFEKTFDKKDFLKDTVSQASGQIAAAKANFQYDFRLVHATFSRFNGKFHFFQPSALLTARGADPVISAGGFFAVGRQSASLAGNLNNNKLRSDFIRNIEWQWANNPVSVLESMNIWFNDKNAALARLKQGQANNWTAQKIYDKAYAELPDFWEVVFFNVSEEVKFSTVEKSLKWQYDNDWDSINRSRSSWYGNPRNEARAYYYLLWGQRHDPEAINNYRFWWNKDKTQIISAIDRMWQK